MAILITGGAGYVGSFAARLFAARGADVVVMDDLSAGDPEAVRGIPFFRGDVGNREDLDRLAGEHPVEGIVHFAGKIQVGESVRKPLEYYRGNLFASATLLEWGISRGIRKFLFSSSAAVYGTPAEVPVSEEAPIAPVSPYGATKAAFERMLGEVGEAVDGFRSVSLRYFNAAGGDAEGRWGEGHEPESHLIPKILRGAAAGEGGIDLFGDDYPTPDGTCIRDYIHVEDLAEAHRAAWEGLERGISGPFNLGTGAGHSVLEVVETARQVTGREIPVRIRERRRGDPPALVASAEKGRREFGWTPRRSSLRNIVETAWSWHKRRHGENLVRS